MKIYSSPSELIGKTPLIELNNIKEHFNLSARIAIKAECFNPAGSAKDRAAKYMLDKAIERGDINKNTVIIEPTSGNTGIGLASIAVSRGYRVILTMPETMSLERRRLLSAYGAEIILTDGAKGMQGAVEKAQELAKSFDSAFIPDQFSNLDNALAHFETTGPEIWEDTDGTVDVFVAGIGTGGTISGVGKFLKQKNKNVNIIGVEPQNSPLISKGFSGAHAIQGIGANFIPELLDKKVIDEVVCVSDEDAFLLGRLIAKKEGILLGISSAAAIAAAVEVAKREENTQKLIVVLAADTGERYLSTKMFE